MIPDPLRIGMRGLLAPCIGFRVAKSWNDATSRSSGYQSPQTINSLIGSDPVDEQNHVSKNHIGSRFQQVASAFLEGLQAHNFKPPFEFSILVVVLANTFSFWKKSFHR
jgi:hypothetical protein